jgi:hypothetical protein
VHTHSEALFRALVGKVDFSAFLQEIYLVNFKLLIQNSFKVIVDYNFKVVFEKLCGNTDFFRTISC